VREFLSDLLSDKWLLCASVAQFFLVLLGAVVTLEEDWVRAHKKLILLSFIILGLIAFVATAKQGGESAVANNKLANSLDGLGAATKEIGRVTSLNTELQEKLLKQGNTIAELARQDIATVTGGDSFSYLAFSKPRGILSALVAIHKGKYALHDLGIRIVDVRKLLEANPPNQAPTAQSLFAGSTTFHLDTFSKQLAAPLTQYVLSSGNEMDFNVFFTASNGQWLEKIELRRVNSVWLEAFIVYADMDKKSVRFEQIEPGFPTNEKGDVSWHD
jgi:hypothetical protein